MARLIVSRPPNVEPVATRLQADRARLRAKADQVCAELGGVVSEFAALGSDHRDHIHVLFAELYLCETLSWLDQLERSPQPEHAYRTIPGFFALYREHVLDRLHRPLHEIAPHWRAYHRLARRLTIRSPISLHLLLISLGAWAHTRFDLGRAICEAVLHDGRAADETMFGSLSDDAFLQATCNYIERHQGRQKGWRRLMLRLYGKGLLVTKPIWLPEFQRWRTATYREHRRAMFATVRREESVRQPAGSMQRHLAASTRPEVESLRHRRS
jgi:hypothetical protein